MTFTSTIKQREVNIANNFLDTSNNMALITMFLDAEKDVALILESTQNFGVDTTLTAKFDSNMLNHFARLETIMGSEFKPEAPDSQIVKLAYNFIGNIYLDIVEQFINLEQVRRGFFLTFIRYIYPFGNDEIQLRYEQLTKFYTSIMEGHQIKQNVLIKSSANGKNFDILIDDRFDVEFAFNVEAINNSTEAIISIDKAILESNVLKKIFNDALNKIIDQYQSIENDFINYGKRHGIEDEAVAFLKNHITLVSKQKQLIK